MRIIYLDAQFKIYRFSELGAIQCKPNRHIIVWIIARKGHTQ